MAGPIQFTFLGRLSKADSRQIFVAYPYKIYPPDDYRKVYADLEATFKVKFVFADAKITDLHILQKIADLIRESRFGIFDISGWNPNVTLELGLAYGMREKAYIAIDPAKTPMDEVPADLRGIDRIQYSSYTQLQEGLARLLEQEFPVLAKAAQSDPLAELQQRLLDRMRPTIGYTMGDVVKLLGTNTKVAQLVVDVLLENHLTATGERRGKRYFKK
jgi:hypothetical protein